MTTKDLHKIEKLTKAAEDAAKQANRALLEIQVFLSEAQFAAGKYKTFKSAKDLMKHVKSLN
jgi:16S rRNA U1498 N3-methylase RsmE